MATTKYPLLFSYNEILSGSGVAVRIAIEGRAVAIREDNGWWIAGVNPGAVAGGGSTLQEAFNDFRRNIKAVCIDFANDAGSFGALKQAIESFFHECDAETIAEWETAREEVRAGRVTLEGLGKVHSSRAPCVRVTVATRPSDNIMDSEPAIAA